MAQRTSKAIIYRPAKGIGIGHFLFSLAGYNTMAKSLGFDFYFTSENTIFSLYGTEQEFLNNYFDLTPLKRKQIHSGIESIQRRLQHARDTQERIQVIGRSDQRQRAEGEFPALAMANYVMDGKRNHLDKNYFEDVDVLYVDSVVANENVVSRFGALEPLIGFSQDYLAKIRNMAGSTKYIGVHVRHGNGEFLDNRKEGGNEDFHDYLEKIALETRQLSQSENIRDILVLSDNADAAQSLAKLCGGRVSGTDNLPDQRFQDFLRSDKTAAADRIDKVMYDFAVLTGAEHIVSGTSLFSRAAHLLAGRGQHIIVESA